MIPVRNRQGTLLFYTTALLMVLGMTPTCEATRTTETLLFEPIGDMITGLSYIHLILPIGFTDLEQQVFNYKKTLTTEFSGAALKTAYKQMMGQNNDPKVSYADTHLEAWERIAQIEVRRAERLMDRVKTLRASLPIPQDTWSQIHLLEEGEVPEDNFVTIPVPMGSSKLRPPRESERNPRSPALLLAASAGLFGFVGTLLGALNTAQMGLLENAIVAAQQGITRNTKRLDHVDKLLTEAQESIIQLNRGQSRMANQLSDLGFEIQAVKDELAYCKAQLQMNKLFEPSVLVAKLNEAHDAVADRIDRYERLMQQLLSRRLSNTFLSDKLLVELHKRVMRQAQQQGYHSLLSVPSELLQVEASHFFNGSHVSIILHVPIAPKDGQMRLYKLHPFPLPFAEGTFLSPNVRNEILAVSNANHRYTLQLSATDLLGCHRINDYHLCDRNGVLNKYPEDTCLGALYHQRYEAAHRLCAFSLTPAREYVYQLMNNWFMIFLQEPLTVPLICANSSFKEWHLRAGVSKQHLPAGCSADFPRHLLQSDISIMLPNDYIQFEMEWDPEDFWPGHLNILPAFRRLENLGVEVVSLPVLQSLVATQTDTPLYFHFLHFGFNGLAVICGIIIMGFCCFQSVRCCQRKARKGEEKKINNAVQQALASVPTLPPSTHPLLGPASVTGYGSGSTYEPTRSTLTRNSSVNKFYLPAEEYPHLMV